MLIGQLELVGLLELIRVIRVRQNQAVEEPGIMIFGDVAFDGEHGS
jgi:hypothetical protein